MWFDVIGGGGGPITTLFCSLLSLFVSLFSMISFFHPSLRFAFLTVSIEQCCLSIFIGRPVIGYRLAAYQFRVIVSKLRTTVRAVFQIKLRSNYNNVVFPIGSRDKFRVSLRLDGFLLDFTGFCWVVLSFARFYWALLDFFLDFAKFHELLLSFLKFFGLYLVVLDFVRFYWVLLGFN